MLSPHILHKIRIGLASKDLSDDKRERFAKAISEVIAKMPDDAARATIANINKFNFHEDPKEMALGILGNAMQDLKKRGNMIAYARIADMHKRVSEGQSNIGGLYDFEKQVLNISMLPTNPTKIGEGMPIRQVGRTKAVVSHELGHGIDDAFSMLSMRTEWKDAWKNEFANKALSGYAETNSQEGFAEFSRLLYGSDADLKKIEQEFPQASAYFKENGLWPKEATQEEVAALQKILTAKHTDIANKKITQTPKAGSLINKTPDSTPAVSVLGSQTKLASVESQQTPNPVQTAASTPAPVAPSPSAEMTLPVHSQPVQTQVASTKQTQLGDTADWSIDPETNKQSFPVIAKSSSPQVFLPPVSAPTPEGSKEENKPILNKRQQMLQDLWEKVKAKKVDKVEESPDGPQGKLITVLSEAQKREFLSNGGLPSQQNQPTPILPGTPSSSAAPGKTKSSTSAVQRVYKPMALPVSLPKLDKIQTGSIGGEKLAQNIEGGVSSPGVFHDMEGQLRRTFAELPKPLKDLFGIPSSFEESAESLSDTGGGLSGGSGNAELVLAIRDLIESINQLKDKIGSMKTEGGDSKSIEYPNLPPSISGNAQAPSFGAGTSFMNDHSHYINSVIARHMRG